MTPVCLQKEPLTNKSNPRNNIRQRHQAKNAISIPEAAMRDRRKRGVQEEGHEHRELHIRVFLRKVD